MAGLVYDALWGLVGKRLPLMYGRDTLHVSPEAVSFVPEGFRLAIVIDPNLQGTEMRLERRCR
jgi:hypothetical protein